MGRRDGLVGQSQHIIQRMKQKKDVATALAIEAMTVQLGATNRKKKQRLAAQTVASHGSHLSFCFEL